MPTAAECPTPNELEQFLLGLADDTRAVDIETHLDECSECQRQLRAVETADDLVRVLRSVGQPPLDAEPQRLTDVSPALVDLLVPHFQRIALLADTAELGDAGTEATVTFDHATDDVATLITESSTAGSTVTPRQLGRYEVRGVLGRGGMGEVLHAYDPLLQRSVAIKVMQADLAAQPEAADQLVREAQAAAAVEHDHIVPIFAVELNHGRPCIVMPLLKGMSLQSRLEQATGPLAIAEILRIGREVAEGLAAAQARGLIHCDIKPANLWLEAPRDRVRILDFGLALLHRDGGSARGGISGTPGYLAPEQAQGLPLDARTDVFSLGCVLYRLATGRAPFTGSPRLKALWTILAERPTAAAELNPAIPAPLSDLIDRMMAAAPDDRPDSAQTVLAALDTILREMAETRTRLLRRRWFAALAGVALLSGGGVGLWAFMTAPRQAAKVPMTLLGEAAPLAIKLRRDGQEVPVTLTAETVVALFPGEYSVELVEDQPGRTLMPRSFIVEDNRPRVMRLVLAGELARHAMHTRAATGIAILGTGAETDAARPLQIWSVGLDRCLVAWDGTTASPSRVVNLPHEARCLAVSPEGRWVATAGGNKQAPMESAIRLWDAQTFTERERPLEGHQRLVLALAWSPNGQLLASAGAEGILLWNPEAGTFEVLPGSEAQTVHALQFSQDGRRLLSAGADGLVTLWDIEQRTLVRSSVVGTATQRAVAWWGTEMLVAGDDGQLRVWRGDVAPPRIVVTRPQAITALATSPRGDQVAWGDATGTIGVWSRTRQASGSEFSGHRGPVQGLVWVGDRQQVVSAGADGTVRRWQFPAP